MAKLRQAPVVFLDANVLFSAAYSPEGRSAALFALARKNLCRLITSRYAVEEARRNLSHKKTTALNLFSSILDQVEVCPEADSKSLNLATALGLDAGDVPILAAAMGHADILVTGDRKHFGSWMGRSTQGIKISGLAELLDLLLPK